MSQQSDQPLICNLDASSPEQRARQAELSREFSSRRRRVEELDDGFAFHFDPNPKLFVRLAYSASLERLCCPFLDIAVGWPHDGETMWLRVTGREGVKAFVREDF